MTQHNTMRLLREPSKTKKTVIARTARDEAIQNNDKTWIATPLTRLAMTERVAKLGKVSICTKAAT